MDNLRETIKNIIKECPYTISYDDATDKILALIRPGLPAPTGDIVSDWLRISALHAPQEQAEQKMLIRVESALGITPDSRPIWDALARFLIEQDFRGKTIETFAANCKLDPYSTPKAHQIAKDPMLIKANWIHVMAVSAPKDYSIGSWADDEIEEEVLSKLISKPTAIEETWERVLCQLEADAPRINWMQETVPLEYRDGIFKVLAPSAYTRDWLKQRVTSTANRLLAGILNDPDVKVEFVAER